MTPRSSAAAALLVALLIAVLQHSHAETEGSKVAHQARLRQLQHLRLLSQSSHLAQQQAAIAAVSTNQNVLANRNFQKFLTTHEQRQRMCLSYAGNDPCCGPTHVQVVSNDNTVDDLKIKPPTLHNVALRRPVQVDSYNPPYVGDRAVDGYRASNSDRWVSLAGKDSNPHYIIIDLGGSKLISQLKFWTGYYIAGNTDPNNQPADNKWWTPIESYRFQRDKGGDWEDVVYVPKNTLMAADHSFADLEAQRVRFIADKVGGVDDAIRMFEIEVHGYCMPSDTEDY